jgi:hypothetical protein
MSDEIPTKQELAWAGKAWDEMSLRECEGIAYVAFGSFMAELLSGYTWVRIGAANQLGLTQAMLALEQRLKKTKKD